MIASTLALAFIPIAALAQAVEDVVIAPQASGHWLRAESDHVIVYSDESAEVLRRVVADLETLDATLRSLYGRQGAPAPRKYPIYLVRAPGKDATVNAQYRRFLPTAAVSTVSTDVAEPEDIFAVVVRDSFGLFGVTDTTAGDDGVLGAYALHFFSETFPFRQPRWLIKGAAIYYSAIDIRPDSVTLGAIPALFGKDLMLQDVKGTGAIVGETGDANDAARHGYDARAAVLVRYLWSDPDRKARLAIYLDRLEAGGDPDLNAAWKAAFGQPVETIDATLKTFLRAEPVVSTLPRPSGPAPTITIRKMPAGAEDLILEIQQLKSGDVADRAGLLRRIRKIAAKRPSERYSRQALARAEITLGDRDRGEAMLAELLSEDDGNLEALRLMGTSKLYRAAADQTRREALLAEARGYLVRADRAELDDYQTLFLLAQTMIGVDGAPPSVERLALLRRAVALAPEVARIRIVAAVAFLLADDADGAFKLLKPLSADPNGGIAARQAQELLGLMARARPVAAPAR